MLEIFQDVLKGTYQEFNGIINTYFAHGKAGGTMKIKPHHLNPNGTIHGGALMTLADSIAMAGLIYTYELNPATTTSLSISFLRTVKAGEIRAEANILSQGKTVSAWQVDCFDEDNNLLAAVQVNFSLLKKGSTKWEKDNE